MIRISKRTGGSAYYDLLLADEGLRVACDRWYDAQPVVDLPPVVTGADDFPVPDPLPVPRPAIGQLFWPVIGARRWARGDFLIAKSDLDLLRAELAYDNQVTLEFRDAEGGADTPRQFYLFLLSAHPLVENPGETVPNVTDAWVITLVDVRYYWQFVTAAQTADTYSFSSWTNLVPDKIAARFGDTITVTDAFLAAFPAPNNSRWGDAKTRGISTAHLLDCAMSFTGSRLVCGPLGTFEVQRPTSANKDIVTDFHDDNLDRHVGGGLIPVTEIRNSVPTEMSAIYSGDPVVNGVKSLLSLALADYGSSTGAGGTGYGWVDKDAPADATLTAAYAENFYLWQLVPLDAQYAGFTTVPVSGFVDRVVYYHDDEEGVTWICRPPENYGAVVRGRPLATDGGNGGILVEVTGYNSATRYHTAKRKTWTGSPGDVADYSPATTYSTCRASARTTGTGTPTASYQIPTGTLCYLWEIPDVSGAYWIEPTGDYATATTPGVVSTYGQRWLGHKVFETGWTSQDTARSNGGLHCYGSFPASNGGPTSDTYVSAAVHVYGGSMHSDTTYDTRRAINARGVVQANFITAMSRFTTQGVTLDAQAGANLHVNGDLASNFPAQFSALYFSQPTNEPGTFITSPRTGETLCATVLVTARNALFAPTRSETRPHWLSATGHTNADGVTGEGGFSIYEDRGSFAVHRGVWGTLAGGVFKGGILVGGADSGPVARTELTTLAPNGRYYADTPVARTGFYLSPMSKAGDRFDITGRGAGGWDISQRAGQTIRTAASATTTGTGGHLRGAQWSRALIECVTDGTDFVVIETNATLTWI